MIPISGRHTTIVGGSAKKILLLTVILLLSATWVVAQNSTTPTAPSGNNAPSGSSDQMGGQNSQGMGSQGSQDTGSMGNETQIEGCLSGSSGSYMLTDASGQTWQLQGSASQLSKHVGESVRIDGTPSGAASSGTSNSGAVGQNFSVSKVRKVSSTCSNAGSTPSK